MTPTDLAQLRDELGTTPDDTTLEDWHEELGHWLPVAIRALKRRRADATAGGTNATSFTLTGVLSVGLSKADLRSLDEQITRLEAAWDAHRGITAPGVRVIRRPDRYR